MTYIIYIPGLGDQYGRLRALGLRTWRLWGVRAVHRSIEWYDGGDMASKLKLIERSIEQVPSGSRIVLVGESAGATLALIAAQRSDRVAAVLTLCGVAQRSTPIATSLRRKAPALDQAVGSLPQSLDVPVHSIRAWIDPVVGERYSTANDAVRHVIWSVGHLTTIALCLTLYAPIISAIAKNTKK